MGKRKTWAVRAERADGWWALAVDGLPGAWSQTRRLEQAETMARDAIAAVTGLADDSFDVLVLPQWPDDLAALAARVAKTRAAAEAAEQKEAEALRLAVRAGVDAGLSMHDVALLTGVSHQRATMIARRAR